jgi:EAL and modified HD-GYP domain-containing signal transduction protein
MFRKLIDRMKGRGAHEQPAKSFARDEAGPGSYLGGDTQSLEGSTTMGGAMAPGFITRRPLIGRKGAIAGLEFRLDDAAMWHILSEGDAAEATFTRALFVSMRSATEHKRYAYAALPLRSILLDCTLELASQGMMICVLPDESDTAGAGGGKSDLRLLAERLTELRARGVMVGWPASWLAALSVRPAADFVSLQYISGAIGGLLQSGKQWARAMPGTLLVATDIASIDDLEQAVRGGIALSSGTFSRAIVEEERKRNRKIAPQHMRLCKILNDLVLDADTTHLAEQMKSDVVLSYRLLRYANSAAMALSRHIDSVPQALLLLGRNELYRWVSVMLVHSANGHTLSGSLQEVSLARARLLELLAIARAIDPPDGLFTVGMFSLLDAMLHVPMQEALEPLSLPPAARMALVEETGPWRPYVDLMLSIEVGEPAGIARYSSALQLPVPVVMMHAEEATRWAAATVILPGDDR